MNLRDLLADTDVLVDYLRGNRKAIAFIEKHSDRMALSVICVAELYTGVNGFDEEQALTAFIDLFRVHAITTPIAIKAGKLKRDFGPSHGIGLADAIIAATCEIENLTLVTLNQKHYPMVKNIHIPYKKK